MSLLVAGMSAATAADLKAGQARATLCLGCHPLEGVSSSPLYPHLAGQPAPYLVKQMQAYRTGLRPDPVMGPLMQTLSEQDMENVAAWFASQAPCAQR